MNRPRTIAVHRLPRLRSPGHNTVAPYSCAQRYRPLASTRDFILASAGLPMPNNGGAFRLRLLASLCRPGARLASPRPFLSKARDSAKLVRTLQPIVLAAFFAAAAVGVCNQSLVGRWKLKSKTDEGVRLPAARTRKQIVCAMLARRAYSQGGRRPRTCWH